LWSTIVKACHTQSLLRLQYTVSLYYTYVGRLREIVKNETLRCRQFFTVYVKRTDFEGPIIIAHKTVFTLCDMYYDDGDFVASTRRRHGKTFHYQLLLL